MMKLRKCLKRHRKGTTLVEMIVTLLLFSILMVMIVGILSPAAKTFVRMQKLQFARLIVDNTIQELQGLTQEAAGYVKIYEHCIAADDVTTMGGKDEGLALEFVNTEGYIVLLSMEGCPKTQIRLGSQDMGEVAEGEITPGRLFVRYYVRDADNGEKYYYKKDGNPVVRACSNVFANGYYMGNYIEVTFSYPQSGGSVIPAGGDVDYLEAEVKLYSDSGKTELVIEDSARLDFRYKVKRKDEVTAENGT